jgi:hypothetical protein
MIKYSKSAFTSPGENYRSIKYLSWKDPKVYWNWSPFLKLMRKKIT